jgi:hypothetical protein
MMMTMRRVAVVAGGVAMVLMMGTVAWGAGKEIKALETWLGKSENEALQGAAPAGMCIADEAAWKKLWQAWRGTEGLPKVDFTKELILVATASGPNTVGVSAKIDEKGNVSVVGFSTMMAGPGFGYAMIKVSREGVKSVEGTALGEATTKPAEKDGAASRP